MSTLTTKVLITGAFGTLGSAFVKYLLAEGFEVVGVDNNEWALAAYPEDSKLTKKLEDFADTDVSDSLAVIHCAAYKHINLGEINVDSLIENNIEKTRKLFKRCAATSTPFLFISTDKAVEPVSAYGYSKALGEKLAWAYGGQVVRSGNFLNSTGSVIPLWEKQIANAEPLSITSKEMTRYVIEADDYVKQVWPKFINGKKLIIPEMGQPVKIMDLVLRVLKKHGFISIADYQPGIKVIGIRPGERLHEVLQWKHELTKEADDS